MNILLAVDGSDYTARMLSYLSAHRDLWGSGHTYTVFHAVPPIPHRAAAFALPEDVRACYEDDARVVLEPIRPFLDERGLDAAFVHKVGHPGEEIASYAEEGRFNLLIMGSHGRSALKNLVLGSVATQVLARCSVPVLLVR